MSNTLSMMVAVLVPAALVACGGSRIREGSRFGDEEAYARYATAELLYEKGDLDGARRSLENALSADDDDAYLAYRLEELIAEMEASEKRAASSRPAGRERGEMSIEIRTGLAAASAKERARELSVSGDLSLFADALELALELDPGDEVLRIEAIDVFLSLGEVDRAERHVLSLRAPDDEDRGGSVRRARLLARVGRSAEAKGLLLLLLEHFPDDPEILLVLSDVESGVAHGAPERGSR